MKKKRIVEAATALSFILSILLLMCEPIPELTDKAWYIILIISKTLGIGLLLISAKLFETLEIKRKQTHKQHENSKNKISYLLQLQGRERKDNNV